MKKKGFAGQQSLQSFSKTAASVSNKGKYDIKQTNKQNGYQTKLNRVTIFLLLLYKKGVCCPVEKGEIKINK